MMIEETEFKKISQEKFEEINEEVENLQKKRKEDLKEIEYVKVVRDRFNKLLVLPLVIEGVAGTLWFLKKISTTTFQIITGITVISIVFLSLFSVRKKEINKKELIKEEKQEEIKIEKIKNEESEVKTNKVVTHGLNQIAYAKNNTKIDMPYPEGGYIWFTIRNDDGSITGGMKGVQESGNLFEAFLIAFNKPDPWRGGFSELKGEDFGCSKEDLQVLGIYGIAYRSNRSKDMSEQQKKALGKLIRNLAATAKKNSLDPKDGNILDQMIEKQNKRTLIHVDEII